MYATEKQIWFIKKLGAERGYADAVEIIDGWDGQRERSLSSRSIREASEIIDWLKTEPVAKAA